jgi:cytochrome c-type biogenesis protein
MIALATSLTEQVLNGSVLLSFPIAVIAGIVAFLSPCVLPLVPAYLSYVTGLTGVELTAKAARGRVLWGTTLFILGFSTVFISYGALFGGAGSILLEQQSLVTKILGVFTVLLGLAFLGVIPNQMQLRPKIVTTLGLAGAPFLGVLFAVGWTPCIGPTLAAVQTLAFSESSAVRGAFLSLGYCIGLGIPFLIAGLGIERSMKIYRKISPKIITRIGGSMLIVLGLAQITGIWVDIVIWLQGFSSAFVTAL